MQTKPFRIGTRGSPLALAQAHETRRRLMQAHGLAEDMFEVVVLSTQGDRITDRPLSEIGGKGLFTAEIEERLLSGELDFAVHSSKDMATRLPDGLGIVAYLPREDVRDAFVSQKAERLLELPQGAMVGTASLRRQALVRKLRPDLKVKIFRGQVDTRLRKLADGEADATLLAYAGLKRLGKPEIATEILDSSIFPPAPAQGAICLEAHMDNSAIHSLLSAVNDPATFAAVSCERAFLEVLDGSCRTPIAGYAEVEGDRIRFAGMVLTPDGQTFHEIKSEGPADQAAEIGRAAGHAIRDKAGTAFFENWG
ncbi:hydroxymethylbilane synthase [Rhizobium sp. KVB221]|uniref:Porphobilinogen deaminase n=1 Tax=Rhizobium setariae TaxID=2801340 RepID=A0A937CR78_9HYPH|nr:hydroxymethylbilane synthase [Rhizobium setariae]MBL0374062.1 hydroxymethylbilane synthase [Rhizobium setariae]